MRKETILIADDEAHLRQALQTRLVAFGYQVIQAFDGLGAIVKSQAHHVDALILDQDMPVGEGRDIARVIREYCRAPIIFLSGHDREDFRETVMRYPNVYYLSKPLDAEKLRDLLDSLLHGKPGENGDAASHTQSAAAGTPAAVTAANPASGAPAAAPPNTQEHLLAPAATVSTMAMCTG